MRKPFITPKRVLLTAQIISRAKKFSSAVINTVDYKDSNQSVKSKIQDDHFISKLGEEAVKAVFEKRGNKVIGPDYKIYDGKKKTWSADLIVSGIDVAVKTQKKSAANKYGLSWTFQNSEIRKDPILKNPESWVCFVECNDSDEKFCCTVFPPVKIKRLQFKEPKLSHLKGKKKVVYAEDILKTKGVLSPLGRVREGL
ncbi:MAG: hypothetical protein ACHQD9_02800 [Chitinophagales bacterium]